MLYCFFIKTISNRPEKYCEISMLQATNKAFAKIIALPAAQLFGPDTRSVCIVLLPESEVFNQQLLLDFWKVQSLHFSCLPHLSAHSEMSTTFLYVMSLPGISVLSCVIHPKIYK